MTILRIDSSINGENSASRAISEKIVDQLKVAQWGEEVVYRDLAANPLPQLVQLQGLAHRHDLPPSRIDVACYVSPSTSALQGEDRATV